MTLPLMSRVPQRTASEIYKSGRDVGHGLNEHDIVWTQN